MFDPPALVLWSFLERAKGWQDPTRRGEGSQPRMSCWGWFMCLQPASVITDKTQPLLLLELWGRTHFRAKPLPWAGGWRRQCLSTVPKFLLNLNANSRRSQSSVQCQITQQPDGTFWSSSTFIRASRDAVKVFAGKCLFLFSSVPADLHWCKLRAEWYMLSMIWSPFLLVTESQNSDLKLPPACRNLCSVPSTTYSASALHTLAISGILRDLKHCILSPSILCNAVVSGNNKDFLSLFLQNILEGDFLVLLWLFFKRKDL